MVGPGRGRQGVVVPVVGRVRVAVVVVVVVVTVAALVAVVAAVGVVLVGRDPEEPVPGRAGEGAAAGGAVGQAQGLDVGG